MKNPLRLWAAPLAAWQLFRWVSRRLRRIELRDRVILITGGSRGLGLALAREFAAQGSKVALCARNPKELELATADLRSRGAECFGVMCDVSDRKQVSAMIGKVLRRFGHVDVLVNNASIIQVGPAEAMSEREFRDAMRVNFQGTLHTSLMLLPRMIERRGSRIVNITSIGGAVSVPHLLPYNSAKFAATGFSLGLAAELAKSGVRVTTVLPGLMRTGSYKGALFKGSRSREFEWFAISSSVPGVTISANRAARAIVRATVRGDAVLVLGAPAKFLRIFYALLPNVAVELFGLVNRLLPGPEGNLEAARAASATPGWNHSTPLSESPITALGRAAGRELHERRLARNSLP